MAQLSFDDLGLVEGRRLRDEGMARAVAASEDDYRAAYRAEFERLLASGEEFTSDEITDVVGMPARPNTVGGLFSGALRAAGARVEVSGWRQSRRKESHASWNRSYRGVQ